MILGKLTTALAAGEGSEVTTGQDLAARVRAALVGAGTVREVKMFGGIGFMLNGNLIAGASQRGLLVRVGKDRHAEALGQPGARPMVMRGRALEGYVYVDPPALDERSVRSWIRSIRAACRNPTADPRLARRPAGREMVVMLYLRTSA